MIDRTEMAKSSNTKFPNRIYSGGVVALLIGMTIYFVYPYFSQGRNRHRRSHYRHNLINIGMALHIYHEAHGSLPPAYIENEKGEKIHSWRALVLPYMGNDEIFHSYKLSEPWYSKHNRSVAKRMARKFKGEDRFWSSVDVESESTETDYVVVIGPQTAFPGKRMVKFDEIKDGMSNTIVFVQVIQSGIDWFEPRDLTYTQVEKKEARNYFLKTAEWKVFPNCIGAIFFDGSVRYMTDRGNAEQWRNLLFINDGNRIFWPDLH